MARPARSGRSPPRRPRGSRPRRPRDRLGEADGVVVPERVVGVGVDAGHALEAIRCPDGPTDATAAGVGRRPSCGALATPHRDAPDPRRPGASLEERRTLALIHVSRARQAPRWRGSRRGGRRRARSPPSARASWSARRTRTRPSSATSTAPATRVSVARRSSVVVGGVHDVGAVRLDQRRPGHRRRAAPTVARALVIGGVHLGAGCGRCPASSISRADVARRRTPRCGRRRSRGTPPGTPGA